MTLERTTSVLFSDWTNPSRAVHWYICTPSQPQSHRFSFWQEQCESQGGCPGLPVPNKPYGFCGYRAALNSNSRSQSTASDCNYVTCSLPRLRLANVVTCVYGCADNNNKIRRWRLVSRAVVIPPKGVIKVVDNKVYRHQCPNKPRYTFILQTNKADNQLENQPTNNSL